METLEQPVHTTQIKSRVWERHAHGLQTACKPADESGREWWPAQIRDVSAGGVGLVVDRYVADGQTLDIETPVKEVPLLSVRVVHATALPGGAYLLGCVFPEPLTEHDLRRLLSVAT